MTTENPAPPYYLADGVGNAGVIDGPFYSRPEAEARAADWNIGDDLVVIWAGLGERAATDIDAFAARVSA